MPARLECFTGAVLQRARAAGFKTIVLTVDAIGQGSSDEYVRLGRTRPWLPYGNFPSGSANAFKTDLSWADLEFTRKVSGLPSHVQRITGESRRHPVSASLPRER